MSLLLYHFQMRGGILIGDGARHSLLQQQRIEGGRKISLEGERAFHAHDDETHTATVAVVVFVVLLLLLLAPLPLLLLYIMLHGNICHHNNNNKMM